MAKVSELKYEIKGDDRKININCDSSGQFSVNIPLEMAESLRIGDRIVASTLSELTQIFTNALKQYKTIETVETLHILIAYQARGKYRYRQDGSLLFGDSCDKHNIKVSFSEIDNALGLDFFVGIKQTIDGKDKWFKAKLGKECAHFEKEYNEPDIYHKRKSVSEYRLARYKIITYDENALSTLLNAQEKLRRLSEMIHNFITQDENAILMSLTNQMLLN